MTHDKASSDMTSGETTPQPKLGLSGRLTKTFIRSPLTPLLLLGSLLVGVIALQSVPREEEPQISVPMVDILISANGYKAEDAVELITRPLEDIVKGINGVEHVYSQTLDDRVMVTTRFYVGTSQDDAVLRVHDKIRANITGLPKGIPEPLIVGRGIDDVAIVVLTLSPKLERANTWTANGLYQVAEELQHELSKVESIGTTYLVGGSPNQIRVEPDPERLSLYGITLNQLADKLTNANRSFLLGTFREQGRAVPVVAGQTLQGVPDIGLLLLTSRDGRPIYVKDVAEVTVGAAQPERFSWTLTPNASGGLDKRPAVSIALAKRKGANAVVVAEDVLKRLDIVKGRIVPDDIEIAVTRNYGETATEKADELLFHLALATVSIVLLITLAIGWREGVVVMVIIPTTILLTLFAAWLMGYTINRVSLFALIFSIGILVDDAIVVVENVVRHWKARGEPRPGRDRDRGGGGGRQPHHRGDLDHRRGAAADDVRVGPDGPLHGADPGQCLDGDAVLVLRRRHHHAVALAQDRAPPLRERREHGRRRPRRRRSWAGSMRGWRRRCCAAAPARRCSSPWSASPRWRRARCSPPRRCG